MPSLQNIESFKQHLNEIGDEPAILEAKGESIEDVSPPEAEDLSGLFDDEIGLTGMDLVEETTQDQDVQPIAESDESGAPAADDGLDDAFSGLDDDFTSGLDDDLDIDDIFPADAPAQSEVTSEPGPEGAVDLGAQPPDFDDLSFPEDSQFEGTVVGADLEPADSDAGIEEFDSVDFDDAFFGEDADVEQPAGEAPEVPVEIPEREPADAGEVDEFADFEDSLPAESFSFDQPMFEEPEETIPEVPEETPAEASTEMPVESPTEDFGDEFGDTTIADIPDGEDDFSLPEDLDFSTDFSTDFSADASADAGAEAGASTDELPEFAEPDDGDVADLGELGDFDAFDETPAAGDDSSSISEVTATEDDGFGDLGEIDSFDLPDEPGFDEATVDETDDLAAGDDLDDFSMPDGFDTGGEEEFSVPDEFSFDDETDTFDTASFESAESADTGADAGFGDDDFSFDDASTDAFASDGEEAASDEVLEATDEDDFDLDDFSLGDIGEEFGLLEEDTEDLPVEEEVGPAIAVSEQLPEVEETFELSDPQFATLQETLNSLPRNLRLIIEELIGEEQLGGADLTKLVDALVRGRSPKEIAAIASTITGEKIIIPVQYEKRTGLEFEEERGTFAYVFKHSVLPVLKIAGAGIGAIVLLSFLGYRFVYRPIRATTYFRNGFGKLENGSYLPANEDFYRGTDLWDRKVWYYRYADEFRARRRDDLAAEKYDQLLAAFPFDRKGLLDYADLETYERARYEHAEELLGRVLDEERYDYDALLLLGDTYTEWAREAPEKYESARYSYATLLEQYGNRDEVMLRMLRHFIRTDNVEEVRRLTNYFQNLEGAEIDPYIYAELGGYYIDRDELDDVKPILFKALDENKFIADVHYNLARYFRKVDDISEESRALTNAYGLLRSDDLLTVDEERMLIDTVARQGEVAYRRDQYLEAQSKFVDALGMYEDALDRGRFSTDPMFGRVYAALGDVFYYIAGQSEPALYNYLEAERNDFIPPELRYKIGNIRYRNLEYDDALIKFSQAAGDYSDNVNLMYATANTLYERGNFAAAQGYFLHILDELETTRRNIPVLRPEEREDHRALIENLMRTYNNLGATLYELSEISGEEVKRSRSLAYLTRSSEFFDRITRDRDTLVRTESKNLSYLNTRAILYPTLDFEVEIYNEIPRDMTEIGF